MDKKQVKKRGRKGMEDEEMGKKINK